MKKILVVSQYFYPENFRINDMCIEWINRGYEVDVLTGIPNYPKGKFYKGYGLFKRRKENYKGISIHRVFILARGNNKFTLLLNYLSFMVSSKWWFLFNKKKYDFIFVFEVSPMTQALSAVKYGRKKKIPLYLYVQDLWPDSLIDAGIKNPLLIKVVNRMVRRIYEYSDYILVTSKAYINSIEEFDIITDKIHYIPQYAEDYYIPQESICDVNELNFIFTGNIGYAQGLDSLIVISQMIDKMRPNIKYKFTLVGNGRYKKYFINKVRQLDLNNRFDFIDAVSPKDIPKLLSRASFAVVTLGRSELMAKVIPAKLQSYMACAMPLLGVVKGETKRIIIESNAGYVIDDFDETSILEVFDSILRLSIGERKKLSQNSREYYENNFDKKKIMDVLDEMFKIEN